MIADLEIRAFQARSAIGRLLLLSMLLTSAVGWLVEMAPAGVVSVFLAFIGGFLAATAGEQMVVLSQIRRQQRDLKLHVERPDPSAS